MAASGGRLLYRCPQSKAVDAVRWLRPISAFDRFIAAAVHDTDTDTDTCSSAVEIHSVNLSFNPENPDHSRPLLHLRSSWPSPSRISSLRTSETRQKHLDGGRECVSVGEDGRVNLVSIAEMRLDHRLVHDSQGLVSYTAARWGSQAEFATGGFGFGLQWWDQRKPGGLVSQFKGWLYLEHAIDYPPLMSHKEGYPNNKVGGSSGTVFAWDLRRQQEPILLSGVGPTGTGQSTSESEVWEVQYDIHTQSSSTSAASSTKILPVMMCSEDGILAVIEQGEAPIELLAEDCAINSFDIDPQNPSDVVCCLEWETIGILLRQRRAISAYS
ncbi:hypothetical protein AXF42_Ash007524 [Apostasia shenzhenica]|uniref:Nuclear pore complex protein NUP43 n=1 Tax=Apostasia shenzhenica TaxID=1088818 RepID=A0A2I0A5P3_9ASPA|nr:hypothetical protein AXF42_Ash007524 [Apostasia shenzhenica]